MCLAVFLRMFCMCWIFLAYTMAYFNFNIFKSVFCFFYLILNRSLMINNIKY